MEKEIEKCKNNPYYFAIKYLMIKDKSSGNKVKFTTFLKEEEFNKIFNYNINFKGVTATT